MAEATAIPQETNSDSNLRRQINKSLKILLIVLFLLFGFFFYQYLNLTKPLKSKFQAEPKGFEFIRSIYGPSTVEPFQAIMGLALDQDNNIYVTDTKRIKVDIFNSNGAYLRSIGERGGHSPSLYVPRAVARDANGEIYVADNNLNKIVVFDNEGKYLRHWSVIMPNEIVIKEDKLYVTTFGPFYIFDKNGKEITKFAKRGRQRNNLDSPYGLVLDGKQFIMADSLNNRIVSMNERGEVKWSLGQPSKAMLDTTVLFEFPIGLAEDEHGLLYLTDAMADKIYVITKKGKIVENFGEEGKADGFFSFPGAIKYMGNRRFAVIDKGNNRVQIIQIGLTTKMAKAIEKETGKKVSTKSNFFVSLIEIIKRFLGI